MLEPELHHLQGRDPGGIGLLGTPHWKICALIGAFCARTRRFERDRVDEPRRADKEWAATDVTFSNYLSGERYHWSLKRANFPPATG